MRGCQFFFCVFACLLDALTFHLLFSVLAFSCILFLPFHLFLIIHALWVSMRYLMGLPPPPQLRLMTSYGYDVNINSSHWLSLPLMRLSLSPSLYPSTSLFSGSHLWSPSYSFGASLLLRGWVWVILRLLGSPIPHYYSLRLHRPIMRCYLLPLASALLYTHPPSLGSFFSLLYVF